MCALNFFNGLVTITKKSNRTTITTKGISTAIALSTTTTTETRQQQQKQQIIIDVY